MPAPSKYPAELKERATRMAIPGAGLRLPIVKQIVEAHQGEIDVDSVPGKGSTFTITLPTHA